MKQKPHLVGIYLRVSEKWRNFAVVSREIDISFGVSLVANSLFYLQ